MEITRESFADFLDRYASGNAGTAEWQQFVVQHHADSFLEEVRRCVVRLWMSQPETDAAHRLLRSWASLLRFSTDAAGERRPEVVTIDLTPSEAVLLDTILRRHSESDRLTVANPAERQCLYNVECLLEKHGDRPLWPSLADAIHELAPEGI